MGEKGSVQGLWVVRIPINVLRVASDSCPFFYIYTRLKGMKTIFTAILISLCSVLAAQPATVYVGKVTNKVQIGPLTGNKNLAFGVKNVAEEVILDKGHDLTNDSTAFRLDLEIVYFDIQQTATGVSVFHKTENETIIRIKGILYTNDKKPKEYVATGKSFEISTSTMIIDEGGGFNQASARSALKKTIINLIEKLL